MLPTLTRQGPLRRHALAVAAPWSLQVESWVLLAVLLTTVQGQGEFTDRFGFIEPLSIWSFLEGMAGPAFATIQT